MPWHEGIASPGEHVSTIVSHKPLSGSSPGIRYAHKVKRCLRAILNSIFSCFCSTCFDGLSSFLTLRGDSSTANCGLASSC